VLKNPTEEVAENTQKNKETSCFIRKEKTK
jgi:hypothetical protein